LHFKLDFESFYDEVEVDLADAIFPNLQKRNLFPFLPSKVETRCCICGLRRAEAKTVHTSFSSLGLKASFFFYFNGDYWRASSLFLYEDSCVAQSDRILPFKKNYDDVFDSGAVHHGRLIILKSEKLPL
jgi:hypothetical protein